MRIFTSICTLIMAATMIHIYTLHAEVTDHMTFYEFLWYAIKGAFENWFLNWF